MAAGFDLKYGEYKKGNLSDDEMWSAFAYLFSSKSVNDTSYKFGFLKAILDNLYNVDNNLTLNFDQLFSKFTEVYWNLVLKHGIRQKRLVKDGRISSLEGILYDAQERYGLERCIPYESLSPEMINDITHKVKQKCKQNVVGALYADLQECLYSFDKKAETLTFNPVMYEFVCKHKVAIEKLNYYEWARFLEKVNKDDVMDHLLSKLDESSKRNNLKYYRNILFEEFESKCFYCHKEVSVDAVAVDHFIPWSFIKDDNLWNFVLACPKCNSSKSDKLADNRFLDLLVKRNNFILVEKHTEMKTYSADRLLKIYEFAMANGYDSWKK